MFAPLPEQRDIHRESGHVVVEFDRVRGFQVNARSRVVQHVCEQQRPQCKGRFVDLIRDNLHVHQARRLGLNTKGEWQTLFGNSRGVVDVVRHHRQQRQRSVWVNQFASVYLALSDCRPLQLRHFGIAKSLQGVYQKLESICVK